MTKRISIWLVFWLCLIVSPCFGQRVCKQSTTYNLRVFMVDSSDHVTGKAGLTLTITAAKSGTNALSSITPTVTEIASGWYNLALTTGNTDTVGDMAIHITGTGADPTDTVIVIREQVLGDTLTSNAMQWAGAATATDDIALKATLAKTTDITGFNDLSTAQVNAEADTALSDVGLTTTITGRIDVATSSRLATVGYTVPPTAAANATAVRSELSTELARLDVGVGTRMATFTYTTPPTAAANATAVRSELTTELARLDVGVGTRMATFTYITPPTAVDNATAVRSELTTELARLDVATSTRMATFTYTAPPTPTQIWTHSPRVLTGGDNIILPADSISESSIQNNSFDASKFASDAVSAFADETWRRNPMLVGEDVVAVVNSQTNFVPVGNWSWPSGSGPMTGYLIVFYNTSGTPDASACVRRVISANASNIIIDSAPDFTIALGDTFKIFAVPTQLTSGGIGLTAQEFVDALKLAPSAGAPVTGSPLKLLQQIRTDVNTR